MTDHEKVSEAAMAALDAGWTLEGLLGTLRGPARDATGNVEMCCTRCAEFARVDGWHPVPVAGNERVFEVVCTRCMIG